MRNKRAAALLEALAVLLCTCACGRESAEAMNQNSFDSQGQSSVAAEAGTDRNGEEHSQRTESEDFLSGSVGESVVLAANVTEGMLRPEFWMEKTAGEVILDQAQIQGFNSITLKQFSEAEIMFDLTSLPETCTRDYVKHLMRTAYLPGKNSYFDGEKLTDQYRDQLAKSRNLGGIPKETKVRYGIAVERTNIRAFPTEDVITGDSGNLYYDELQHSELLVSEPVAIFHTSLDGQWYFGLSNRSFGWFRADSVALCPEREQWLEWQEEDDILVVTGKRVVLDRNPYDPDTASIALTMGTVLKLAKEEELAGVDFGRTPYGCYAVKIPVRDEEGNLAYTCAYLPMGEDVSAGYLPYTQENLLRQIFKMMGTTYGWGGINGVTDCSGYVYQVYRCFGFQLPRNSSQQASIPCNRYDISGMDAAEKKAVLDSLPPGSLLRFPGHIMFYLGKRGDNYYVISALSNFVPENEEAVVYPRSVMINTLAVHRADMSTWLENLTTACVIE